jgi:hypothetical protein
MELVVPIPNFDPVYITSTPVDWVAQRLANHRTTSKKL